jgi:hypothetical protein
MREIDPLLSADTPPTAVLAAQEKCPAGPHRSLVALWLRQPGSPGDLDALLASDLGIEAHRHLLTTEPAHRAALVKLVLSDSDTQAVLTRLVEGKTVLEPALLEALAGWYVKPTALFSTGARSQVLRLFSYAHAAPDGPERTRAARLVLTKATVQAKDDAPLLESARVTLGDRERIGEAAKGLRAPVHLGSPSKESDLVAWGLWLAGCPQEELVRVAEGKKRVPTCGPAGSTQTP